MSRQLLKNFCIEPSTRACVCTRDIRCGGIIVATEGCPEHDRAVSDLMKTHFHPIQGDAGKAVGTRAAVRYDDAKAS